jgi:DNA-binding GntR family transcriptional regulator
VIGQAGPEYRQAADVIKSKITAGEDGFRVGDILTITRMKEITGAKYATARAAADHLKAEGILMGHQGKGYQVVTTPADLASERMSVEVLSKQVAELRELAERDGLDEMRAAIGRLEANLIELYGKLGYDYPQDVAHDAPEAAVRRGRRGR